MTVLSEVEGAVAGVFRNADGEYVALAGALESGTQGFLIIADKLLPFAGERLLFLEILDRLNRGTLAGIYQLLEYPDGVIYLYKQVFCLQQEMSREFFDCLLETGIREFRLGLLQICRELESVLTGNRRSGGSRMGTGRN